VLTQAGVAGDGEAVGEAFAEGLDLGFLIEGEHQKIGVGVLVECPQALQFLPEAGIVGGLPGAMAMPGKAGGVQPAAQGLSAGHGRETGLPQGDPQPMEAPAGDRQTSLVGSLSDQRTHEIPDLQGIALGGAGARLLPDGLEAVVAEASAHPADGRTGRGGFGGAPFEGATLMPSQQNPGSRDHRGCSRSRQDQLSEQDFFFGCKNYCSQSLGCHEGSLLSGVGSTPYSHPKLYLLPTGSRLL